MAALRGTVSRPFAGFLAIAMTVYLAVISLAVSKLSWYLVPIYPLVGFRAEEYQYSRFLSGPLAPSATDRLVVVHPGFPRGTPYFGPVRFYAVGLTGSEDRITFQLPTDPPPPDGSGVISCGTTTGLMRSRGATLDPVRIDGKCGLYIYRAPLEGPTPTP